MAARARDAGKVLDQVARARRQKKALEALEQDNFQDEPHADLVMNKRAPKFQEALDGSKGPTKRRKFRPPDYYKKYRKNISQMIEEDIQRREDGNCRYIAAQAPPSKLPARHFCNVCGFPSTYTCVQCGVKYCSIKCYSTHQDTRCLKWTA